MTTMRRLTTPLKTVGLTPATLITILLTILQVAGFSTPRYPLETSGVVTDVTSVEMVTVRDTTTTDNEWSPHSLQPSATATTPADQASLYETPSPMVSRNSVVADSAAIDSSTSLTVPQVTTSVSSQTEPIISWATGSTNTETSLPTQPEGTTGAHQEDTTLQSNQTFTVSFPDTTVEWNQTSTVPSPNTTVQYNQTSTVPSPNTTVPSNQTSTVPFPNTTVQSNQTSTVPFPNTTVPSNQTSTVPSPNTTVQYNQTSTVPSPNTTVQYNQTSTVPSPNTTVQYNQTSTVPSPNTTVQYNQTSTVPSPNTTVQSNQTSTLPSPNTTVQYNQTSTVPSPNTTVQVNQTSTVPFPNSTVQANQTSPITTSYTTLSHINTTSVADTTSASRSSLATTKVTATTPRTQTAAPTPTEISETDKQQKELYPYGSKVGDCEIKTNGENNFYYWYDAISKPIYFQGGVPFGSEKVYVAHVLPNGAITFGSPTRAWWPDLSYAYSQINTPNVLAPFWTYANPWQKGKVYYHLYQQDAENNGDCSLKEMPKQQIVLNRASNEIMEHFGLEQFTARLVLVATWEKMEPHSWYMWLCEYYEYYKNDWWWKEYYEEQYNRYCTNIIESNTFQAVYISDGQTAYAIVTYKKGEMKWLYEQWRPIAVGFVSSDTLRDYGVSYTDLTTKMDSIVWNSGRYGTWIEQVGKAENRDSQCRNFYLENKQLITNNVHQNYVKALFECPCSLERMGAQWWSLSWEEDVHNSYIVCYAISPVAKSRLDRLRGNPLNKLCCYRYTYPSSYDWNSWNEAWRNAPYIGYRDPNAGHLLLNDPWWWWGDARKSKEQDFLPHKWCCQDSSSPSKYCQLFNEVRPDYGCSQNPEFVSGAALGDPHILTIDGHGYTFNGLGEFILLAILKQDFMFQGRTRQVLNSQGNRTAATVFIAFAAKEGNYASFQVELDLNSTGMVVLANGEDITRDFYSIDSFNKTFGNNSISISKENREDRITVAASFPSGLSIKVHVGFKNLEFSINVPKFFQNQSRGLLGNFNGDPNDDFVLPDGTQLKSNMNEREIFEKFGREWEVTTSSTVFSYPEGESALDYQYPDFVPIFREEVDSAVLAQAKLKCGGNDACIFDYIATGDEKFANYTKQSNEEVLDTRFNLENNLPTLRLLSGQLSSNQWEVNHGQTATLKFEALDSDESDLVTYMLVGNCSDCVVNSTTGVLTYTPDFNNPISIGLQAQDSKGGRSAIIYFDLVVCPDCSGHGKCDRSRFRDEEMEAGRFVINTCICWPAHTGENCEAEFNACEDRPCHEDQVCVDLTAAEQGNNTKGYSCGGCPDGFEEMDNVCIDKNECIVNGTGPACQENALCENSVGSYTCTCELGYRSDPKNVSSCRDIDECAERIHTCQQLCENTDGSFSCSCYGGNELQADQKSCVLNPANNELCKSCNQVCTITNGVPKCTCNVGYQPSNDDSTPCTDINECTSGNKPCSQSCQNIEGGFLCSCYPGYRLDQDGVSCNECPQPYYGTNCSSFCVCNGHGTCHPVRGCECNAGWSGTNCNKDLDECTTNANCTVGQRCVNTLGSFECVCSPGYIMNNNMCQDINECLDVLDNNCDLSVEDCVNNHGSYSCVCRKGYARNKNNICEDVDECTMKTHNCDQLCENTPGGFNCKCSYGFKLDIDRISCVTADSNVCSVDKNLECEHFCTWNLTTKTAHCVCRSGYFLENQKNCKDINECDFDHLNLCDQKYICANTEGSYNCSCLPGSKLENDGRSCSECSQGKWGLECRTDCACSTGADRCDSQRGCICKHGYTGPHCEKDVDECITGLLICKAGENCRNILGGAYCHCYDGYSNISGKCEDVDECEQPNSCEQVCENYPGGYSCSCHKGYTFNNTDGRCQDLDECNKNIDRCEQICENVGGGYRCACQKGYQLERDGVSCKIVTECTSLHCEYKCAQIEGIDKCICQHGQQPGDQNHSICTDMDLCQKNPCLYGCVETNDNTSIQCVCPAGKKLATDGITCQDCVEGSYGMECNQKCICNPLTTQSCDKIGGRCVCKDGWASDNCGDDINECNSVSNCQPNSICENTPGSYICKCNKGFFTSGNECKACPSNTYGEECVQQCDCDLTHSSCDRVSGDCVCDFGWNGSRCDTDINECDSFNSCTGMNKSHWICINTPGSFKCGCKIGYEEKDGKCVDRNECEYSFSNQCNQNCNNTDGSYACSCNTGYTLGSNGYTCEDTDECELGTSGCQQRCTNKVGTFVCSCNNGYEIDEDKLKCYESASYSFQVTLDMDVTGKNLKEQQGKAYLELKGLLEPALNEKIQAEVQGLRDVLITKLSHGSVIVDLSVIIDIVTTPNAASKMVEAIMKIAQEGLLVNGTHYKAEVKVGNITVPPILNKCTILNAIESCMSDTYCSINNNGEAYCRNHDTDEDNLPLIIGLGVGIPLAIALIVAIAYAVWYRKKYKKQRRVNVRVEEYQESRAATPEEESHYYYYSDSAPLPPHSLEQKKLVKKL